MKKIHFIIRNKLYDTEIDLTQEVIAEEYDEFVYYVSPRIDLDFKYPYSFYDKKTGLMVCTGKNKKELINKYNEVKDRYKNLFGGKLYKECIEKYEQLKKEVNV